MYCCFGDINGLLDFYRIFWREFGSLVDVQLLLRFRNSKFRSTAVSEVTWWFIKLFLPNFRILALIHRQIYLLPTTIMYLNKLPTLLLNLCPLLRPLFRPFLTPPLLLLFLPNPIPQAPHIRLLLTIHLQSPLIMLKQILLIVDDFMFFRDAERIFEMVVAG